jgi:hypothetical protein
MADATKERGPALQFGVGVVDDSGFHTLSLSRRRRRSLWNEPYVGIDLHRLRSVVVRVGARR